MHEEYFCKILIQSVDKYLFYEYFSKKRSASKQLAQHKRAARTKYYEFRRNFFHDKLVYLFENLFITIYW